MSRSTLIRLFAVMLVLTAVQSVVFVNINWDGPAASVEAGKIDTLLNVMIVLSSFVFSVVCVMLGYCVWKYRARPGDESDGAPIHGNTTLEIAWTVIPTVIVLFGAVYSWIVLDDIGTAGTNPVTVNVTAQQYEWTFAYPDNGGVKSTVLHVPVNQRVKFRLHALDVLHSFWVPEWRVKKDAVPGQTTNAYTTPDKPGTFTLVCTELCGFGHSTMRAKVIAESPADFHNWVVSQPKAAAG